MLIVNRKALWLLAVLVAGTSVSSAAYATSDTLIYSNDANGLSQPASATNPVPVTRTSATQASPGSDATKATAVQGVTGGKAVKVDGSAVTQPVSAASLPLPSGAATAASQSPTMGGTGITCSSGDVANTAAVCTLAGTAGKTTYITGFKCTATGATAALVVDVTVAGVSTGTMTYVTSFPAGAATLSTGAGQDFTTPVPASAQNTAIVVTLPAGGTGSAHSVCVAQGFQL